MCLLFTLVVTPFEVAYIEPKFDALYGINRLVDLLFLTDLICQFFSPYYDSQMGGFVVEHKLIAKHYLTGWFIIDFVSILPFCVVSTRKENYPASEAAQQRDQRATTAHLSH